MIGLYCIQQPELAQELLQKMVKVCPNCGEPNDVKTTIKGVPQFCWLCGTQLYLE